MTPDQAPDQAPEMTRVARDLTAIETLAADLEDQAEHTPGNGAQMPGGDAMAMLGPVANLEAWSNLVDYRDEHGLDSGHVDDHDPDWEPCIQTLSFWSEAWRVEHDAVTDLRPTVAREAGFLRQVLHWAWEHEVHWADFADDIHAARVRLENTLRAGDRPERAEAHCLRCNSELIRPVYDDGISDRWRCTWCHHELSTDDYNLALSEFTQAHLATADALAVRTDTPANTIRQWASRGLVKRWGRNAAGRTLYRIAEVERHAEQAREVRGA